MMAATREVLVRRADTSDAEILHGRLRQVFGD
jgi:hypothetical protein